MSDIVPLLPRKPVPPLSVPLAGGGRWSLSGSEAERFTLIVFYRGLHCPICKAYLGKLQALLPELESRGVKTIAISADTAERAEQAKADWGLGELAVGYGLDLTDARRWGLYISTSRGATSAGVEEPALFSEPGLFLVRPDGTLFYGSVQTMPFARPNLAELIPALDFVAKVDYPARGEVETLAAAAE